jgi:hypothetical protein
MRARHVPTHLAALLVLAALLAAPSAFATATYDFTSEASLLFNVAWQSYTTDITPASGGTGAHQETTAYILTPGMGNTGFFQSVHIMGSAGDATFTNSGFSTASLALYTSFTFDFGTTPVDFAMTFADLTMISTYATQLPWNGTGEYITGCCGIQLFFDGFGGNWFTEGHTNIISQVTGVHTVRLGTFADASATANYPYVVTPEPSSSLLFALGLALALAVQKGARWRIKLTPSR